MLLAYDLGTGGAKASLYENDGTLLAASFESYQTLYPQSGWHEQRPEDWRQAIIASTRKLLAQTGADPNKVEAIALSGHSLGCVPLDKSGKLLLDATPIWSDSRAGSQAEKFFKTNDYLSWYRKTGAGFPPGLYTLFKLLWYKENLPDMFAQMDKFIGTKDYVNYWLTGVIATDYSYASGCGAYSLTDWNYSEEIISASGLPRSIFPDLYPSTGVLGTLTAEAAAELGLPQSVKVCAGGVDNSCMALGAKCYSDGRSYASLGSSSWIAVSNSYPLLDDTFKPYVFAHVVPGQFASATAIFSAGTTLRWIRDNFCKDLIALSEQTGENSYALMMKEADEHSEIGAKGLLLNPTFAGGSSLEPSPDMRGGLFNIDLSHTRADVIRAALEGVALNLRKAFDALDRVRSEKREGNQEARSEKREASDAKRSSEVNESNEFTQSCGSANLASRLSPLASNEHLASHPTLLVGGGAISPIWRRIYCDAWNRPIEKTNIDQDAAALGAAAIAAVGIGLWNDFTRLDEIHVSQEILNPIPENAEKYNQILPKFKRTAEMLSE